MQALFLVKLSVFTKKTSCRKTTRSSTWLRGLDSNERPPGYEPGELPTAPPRDVIMWHCFSNAMQRYDFFLNWQTFCEEKYIRCCSDGGYWLFLTNKHVIENCM